MLQSSRELAGARRLEVELGPDRCKQLTALLSSGKPAKKCVQIIQDEWKVLLTHKPSSILTMVYRFSRDVVQQEVAIRIKESIKVNGATSVTTLEDMKEMVGIQRARVHKSLALEQRAPMLLKQTTEEVRLMADMLRNLAAIQIEVGILPRAPKTVKGVLIGEDGRPTIFGWVENDDVLISRLEKEIEGHVEPEPDDPE